MPNKNKIILDLCGGTGAWSKPYKEAGYDVRVITLPEYDVRDYEPPKNVYGILAAPDCTEFAMSGARWWKSKPAYLLIDAIGIVIACLRIIKKCNPVFWCLENPVGRLKNFIGDWVFIFQPNEYGADYTKKTCLWGKFNIPVKTPVEPVNKDYIHKLPPGPERKKLRSITPQKFAKAFYEANRR